METIRPELACGRDEGRLFLNHYGQAMLGHVKLDTTQIYTQVSIKKLKEVHTLTHPAKAKRTKQVDWDEEPESEELPAEESLMEVLEADYLDDPEQTDNVKLASSTNNKD